MQFCPVGYITIPTAVQAILETLYPDQEQNARADLAEHQSGPLPSSYHQYCERRREAEDLLLQALAADELVALVRVNGEDWTVPREYWETDGARGVSLNDSVLDTHHSASTVWPEHHGRLCVIEEAPFRRWLDRTCRPAAPTGAASAVVTKAFDGANWGYMMVLTWVYFRERVLVERVADSAINGGTFWQQETLPDGRTELVKTYAGPITPIWLTLLANQRRGNPATAATAPKITCSEAEAAILDKLKASALTAYGLEDDAGDLRPIPALWWADGKVYEGHNGRPYAGPEDVFRSGATRWYGLLFTHEQVLTLWPEPLAADSEQPAEAAAEAIEPDIARTGGAGRPTIMHLIKSELVARAQRGALGLTLATESDALRTWAAKDYPNAPTPSTKAIQNSLRDLYRQHAQQHPK